jgi:hypothetical protein
VNLVLQVLLFGKVRVCRDLPGGGGIGHRPNESSVDCQFNVGTSWFSFESGVDINKCFEGLGGDHFYDNSRDNLFSS